MRVLTLPATLPLSQIAANSPMKSREQPRVGSVINTDGHRPRALGTPPAGGGRGKNARLQAAGNPRTQLFSVYSGCVIFFLAVFFPSPAGARDFLGDIGGGLIGGVVGGFVGSQFQRPPPVYYPPPPVYYPPAPRYYPPAVNYDPVAVCIARFRSYNPETGIYWGYDGQPHRCP
jgi:hypothetical protein